MGREFVRAIARDYEKSIQEIYEECGYYSKQTFFRIFKSAIGMTPNEYRAIFNLPAYEGGDEFVLRLDTAKTGDTTNGSEGNKEEEENGN